MESVSGHMFPLSDRSGIRDLAGGCFIFFPLNSTLGSSADEKSKIWLRIESMREQEMQNAWRT